MSGLKTAAKTILGFFVVTYAAVIVENLFSREVTIAVLVVGLLLLALFHREELKLPALSAMLLHKGKRHPVLSSLTATVIGGIFVAALFGGSWLYVIYDFKKNPPPSPPSPSPPHKAKVIPTLLKPQPETPRPKEKPPPSPPSIALVYSNSEKRLLIFNNNKEDLFFWSFAYGKPDTKEHLAASTPRVVPPGPTMHYYVFADRLQEEIMKAMGEETELRLSCWLYLTKHSQKYTVNAQLFARLKNGVLELHAQNLGTVSGWLTIDQQRPEATPQ